MARTSETIPPDRSAPFFETNASWQASSTSALGGRSSWRFGTAAISSTSPSKPTPAANGKNSPRFAMCCCAAPYSVFRSSWRSPCASGEAMSLKVVMAKNWGLTPFFQFEIVTLSIVTGVSGRSEGSRSTSLIASTTSCPDVT
jgi:hypothetical protein